MFEENTSYNPESMFDEIEEYTEHGKARMEAIRYAIQQADKHQDIPYMLFFRIIYCRESTFYGDGMELMIIFPELLALADKYPDTPGNPNFVFKYEMEHVMWVYKWILDNCNDFYQISMEDCKNFYEDYRKRCVSMGISLRNYYCSLYGFYKNIDSVFAEECFHKFEKLPRDAHSDCRACERNVEIKFYLDKDNLKKAEQLSKIIENFTLTCGGNHRSAWLRMKIAYMRYYMKHGDYEEAETFCYLIKNYMNGETEYECWEDFLACYAHTNIGKALKIYKDHWKEWLNTRCPIDLLYIEEKICVFFKELMKTRKKTNIKINYDASFPLYREEGNYKIAELYDFYYQRAYILAQKFDVRNGTDFYQKRLERSILENENV